MSTLIIKNTAHDGYRRTGIAFARGETRLPMAQFTQEQIAALENDPYLFVTVVDDDCRDAGPMDGKAQIKPLKPKAPAKTPAKGHAGKAAAEKTSAPVTSDVTPAAAAPAAE